MICTADYLIEDAFGDLLQLGAGEVYMVSPPRNGRVTVFSKPMLMAPAWLFRRKRSGRGGSVYSKTPLARCLRRKYWAQQRREAA